MALFVGGGVVEEAEVVDHDALGHARGEGGKAVGAYEEVGFEATQRLGYAEIEPEAPQQRVPRRWPKNYKMHIGRKACRRIEGPVEDEVELVFGMVGGQAAEGFLNEVAAAFELVGQQESGIDGDDHEGPKLRAVGETEGRRVNP